MNSNPQNQTKAAGESKNRSIRKLTLSRTSAIRLYCLDCTAGSRITIADCSSKDCALYPFRMKKAHPELNKQQIINRYCRECIGEAPVNCQTKDCSLHPFRTGTRTNSQTVEGVFKNHVYCMGKERRIGMAAMLRAEVADET